MIDTQQHINLVQEASAQSPIVQEERWQLPSLNEEKKFNKFGEKEHTIKILSSYLHDNLPDKFTSILEGIRQEEKAKFISKSPAVFKKIKEFVEQKKKANHVAENTGYMKLHGGDYYGKLHDGNAEGAGILFQDNNIWIGTFENNDLKDKTVLTQITEDGIIKQFPVRQKIKIKTFNSSWESSKHKTPINSGQLYYCDTQKQIELLAKVNKSKVESIVAKATNLYYKSNGNKHAILNSQKYKLYRPNTNSDPLKNDPKKIFHEKESSVLKKGRYNFQKQKLQNSIVQKIDFDGKSLEASFLGENLGTDNENIKLLPGEMVYVVSDVKYIFTIDAAGNLGTNVRVCQEIPKNSGNNTELALNLKIQQENISSLNLGKQGDQNELNKILKAYTKDARNLISKAESLNSAPSLITKYIKQLENLDLRTEKKQVSKLKSSLEKDLLRIGQDLGDIYDCGSPQIRDSGRGIPDALQVRPGCTVSEEILTRNLPDAYVLKVQRSVAVDLSVQPPREHKVINGVSICNKDNGKLRPCINYNSLDDSSFDFLNLGTKEADQTQEAIFESTITLSGQGTTTIMEAPFVLLERYRGGKLISQDFKKAVTKYIRADKFNNIFEFNSEGKDPLFLCFERVVTSKNPDLLKEIIVKIHRAFPFGDYLPRVLVNIASNYPDLRENYIWMLNEIIKDRSAISNSLLGILQKVIASTEPQ